MDDGAEDKMGVGWDDGTDDGLDVPSTGLDEGKEVGLLLIAELGPLLGVILGAEEGKPVASFSEGAWELLGAEEGKLLASFSDGA